MSKKKCLDCDKLFEPKRADAKFCSTTCKARFHVKKKNKEILNGITPSIKSDNPDKENKQVVNTINTDELKPCDNLIGGLKSNKVKENGEEQENETPMPDEYITRTITTVNPAYQSCSEELYKCRKSLGELDECLQSLDWLIEYFYNEYVKNLWPPTEKADEHKEQWDRAKRLKEKCLNIIPLAKEREKELLEELKLHPAEFQTQQQELNSAYTEALKQKEEKLQKETVENTEEKEEDSQDNSSELNEEKNDLQDQTKNSLETDKIISMEKIAKLKLPLLNFSGKWLDFFGPPQINFFCVIHGMSGGGKSHFAMQFGKYLAENFGNVLYISGEEGFAVTFQQKIKVLGANIKRYYGSEIKTGEGILNDVPNQYHFIIIDSVNNMRIDPAMLKTIRTKYKQSGIIAICQNTKDGKIRGSYEFVHDSDIAIEVAKGIAITTKNRFNATDKKFDVFEVYRK